MAFASGKQGPSGSFGNHTSGPDAIACIHRGPLVICIGALISSKALVSNEIDQGNGFFPLLSAVALSSAQAASNASSWWKTLLSMDNPNTCCFGRVELA